MSTTDTSPAAIRAHYGSPSERALRKELTRLDGHAQAFIALSPFLVIASSDAAGRGDATPRGDAPGFVAVLDEVTLLIPDRPGNRRADTMLNVAENPQVGLLFLVPGLDETLRVNGRARFTTDEALLAPLAVEGRNPVAGLVVAVEEVFFHCGKAMLRSRIWDPDRQVARGSFPSLGRILADQIAGEDTAEAERAIEESYRTRLY
ncbi:pyridoxamine 5'-phosphate oxidase family protein [Methylobacterium nodulans]|uniref:Pyridoxamine 5'-phosphate oxidase-related FMN-binding n=1 Tax=Methylobacterium nodulans (strain LMG 21967 / CNCM I-2342 / ORS 2060) TaxID=460265 RepID=B8ID59_METNO|nr:pyridoxamine 5'-phosphate oxidase family protein [Methylobacterium nodulans]ACL59451.1 pyridoxamine 5'-phosphate oxidase-related FMN-binding [Methylobacterium nodulans ORS 2060]